MKTAAEILKSKADPARVLRITPEASVYDAVRLMTDKSVGALLVTEGERVVGIYTERDHLRKVAAEERQPRQIRVREVMSSPVMYVRPAHTSDECMALMTENRLRHLPVMDGERLLGLISIGDLVKGIISEQQFIIEQLEHYITGERS